MADPSAVLKAVKTNIGEIETSKKRLGEIGDQMKAISVEQAALKGQELVQTSRGKRTTPEAEAQELQADLAVQTHLQEVAAAGDFRSEAIKHAQIIKETGAEITKKYNRAIELDTGNPLQQLLGVVAIPFLATEIKNLRGQQAASTQTMAQMNQLIQHSAQSTALVQTRITEATNETVVNAIKATQDFAALETKRKNIATEAQLMSELTHMNSAMLDARIKEYTILKGMEHETKAALAEKSMEEAFRYLNLAAIANGKVPFPETSKELIKDQLNRGGETGQLLTKMVQQGLQIEMAGGKIVQGGSPVEAAEFRASVQYTPQSKDEEHTLNLINASFGSRAVKEAKSKEDKIRSANEAVANKLRNDETNVRPDTDSFARPISYATAATSKAVTSTKGWKEVVAPTITDNISTNMVDPADLFDRLLGGVVAGKISPNDATKTAKTFAQYSIGMNNLSTGLTKFTGLAQTKFIAKVPQPAAYAGAKIAFFGAVADVVGLPAAVKLGLQDTSIVKGALTADKFVDWLDDADLNLAFSQAAASKLLKENK